MLIQEKYKNHLCVTIPNIGEPNSLKFSDYVPIQPLETFWKPPRPPSRKKKKPKEYEQYPLGCTHCPKRFTSEILQSFHVKVYHNAHFQVSSLFLILPLFELLTYDNLGFFSVLSSQ